MIDARGLAFQILLHLDQKAAHPDRMIRATLARHSLLDEREKALLTELVYGVLRWQGRLDWHIDDLSRVRPDKIASGVRILLRLALYQIFFLDKIPHHAAVNEAVKVAGVSFPKHITGFVNGLLREALRREGKWDLPSRESNPAEHLAVTASYPLWFVRRCLQEMGWDETEAFCRASNEVAPLVVRVNPSKGSVAGLLQSLEKQGVDAGVSPVLEGAVRMRGLRRDLGRLEAFREGWIQAQDEASQLISILTAPRPGERVLDLCAGFGGKSTHLAQLMENRGEILAVDDAAWKLESLEENAARQSVTILSTLARDVLELSVKETGLFDRVLLDAPCSGFGALRRKPDIKWRRHIKDPYRFSLLQKKLLHQAAMLVKKGGVLVYATCTIFNEENEGVAEEFTREHSDFQLENAADYLPGAEGPESYIHGEVFRDALREMPEGISDAAGVLSGLRSDGRTSLTRGSFLRTWPHLHDVDAFFAVRWRKVG